MQFYVLETPNPDSLEDRAGRIDAMPEEGFKAGPAPRCPRCDRFLGMLTWLPPHRLELETWGQHYGDIARTGDDLIISNRFKVAFEQTNLRGLESFDPVEVVKVTHCRGKPTEPIPCYLKATVVHSSTTIDQQASGYVWENASKACPECLFDTLKRCKCQIIKRDTWNGDDIFFPRGGNSLIVSEHFRLMFLERKLLGAVFVPSESNAAGYDSFPWDVTTNQG